MSTTGQQLGDNYHSVSKLIARIEVGDLTPTRLMESYLEQIARYDEHLHAFVVVYGDEAMRAAEAATQAIASGHRVGPLHGIPVAVKDIVDIEGRVTTGGSLHWQDRVSPHTATLVARMVAQGMIVIGKTHTVEFAMGGWGTNQRMGTPWNPWDMTTHRTPGGSSAGSGVAVAAGMAPWAIGTDTGGSVRLPSAWCGLTGLKTTLGRISTFGVLPLSPTLDTPGPMCRSVADASLLYEVLRGYDPNDPNTLLAPRDEPPAELGRGVAGLRLAVMPRNEREGVDSEVLAAFDESVSRLRALGAEVVELDRLPLGFAEFTDLTGKIIFTEGYGEVGDFCDDPALPLDEDVRPRILAGKPNSAREYLDARKRMAEVRRAFASILSGFDAMLTPGTATPAVPLGEVDQGSTPAVFTRVFNLLGMCALVQPNGFTQSGLPTSLQIACDPFHEHMALRIGSAFERDTDWTHRTPPL